MKIRENGGALVSLNFSKSLPGSSSSEGTNEDGGCCLEIPPVCHCLLVQPILLKATKCTFSMDTDSKSIETLMSIIRFSVTALRFVEIVQPSV